MLTLALRLEYVRAGLYDGDSLRGELRGYACVAAGHEREHADACARRSTPGRATSRGTDRPALIPGRVSHGCIRLRNPDIRRLARLMPVGTSLSVR